MKSLDFPVAAPVAAPIKFAWISSSRGFVQEREAVRGFSCAICARIRTCTAAIRSQRSCSASQ